MKLPRPLIARCKPRRKTPYTTPGRNLASEAKGAVALPTRARKTSPRAFARRRAGACRRMARLATKGTLRQLS